MTAQAPAVVAADYAAALAAIDAERPVWKTYQPGIGPHPETAVVRLVAADLAARFPDRYSPYRLGAPYPSAPRQKCDWVIGDPPVAAIEVKMLRLMGDNGKPNDNMLMHILSPYPAHRSALTDCSKLTASGFSCNTLVLVYGFDYPEWPMDPAIDAFEALSRRVVRLDQRGEAEAVRLVHPVHTRGRVFCWRVREHEAASEVDHVVTIVPLGNIRDQ